jgi:hypothetical protein
MEEGTAGGFRPHVFLGLSQHFRRLRLSADFLLMLLGKTEKVSLSANFCCRTFWARSTNVSDDNV